MNEQRDNSGILFKNDKKTEATPTWPDYQGSIQVAGVDYWLSAWIKTGQKGKLMSLSVKPKDQSQSKTTKPQTTEADDDLPF